MYHWRFKTHYFQIIDIFSFVEIYTCDLLENLSLKKQIWLHIVQKFMEPHVN
jgi:hypothetical protein